MDAKKRQTNAVFEIVHHHSRFEGFTEVVQDVLDLAGVRTNLVEDAAIGLLGAGGTAVGRRTTKAISRRAALHCCRIRLLMNKKLFQC